MSLAQRWSTTLPWGGWVSHAPLVCRGAVLGRSGARVFAASLDSGEVLWSEEVDPTGDTGRFLLGYGNLAITDVRPDPERLTRAVAVSTTGGRQWEADLGVIIGGGGAVTSTEFLSFVGMPAEGGPRLVRVRPKNGTIVSSVALEAGADELIETPRGFLIASGRAPEDAPGVYVASEDGSVAEVLERGSAEALCTSGEQVAALAEREGARTVVVRAAASLAEAWCAPASGRACAIDADDVAYFDEANQLVLCKATTGERRWSVEHGVKRAAWIGLVGTVVVVGNAAGLALRGRTTGAHVADVALGRSAIAVGDGLMLGGRESLTYCDMP